MQRATIYYSLYLIALGAAGFIASGGIAFTALIPVIFAALVLIAAHFAKKEHLRKHAMHGAAAISLIAILGSASGVPATIRLFSGEVVERPIAALAQCLMFAGSLVYFLACVGSFIKARRG